MQNRKKPIAKQSHIDQIADEKHPVTYINNMKPSLSHISHLVYMTRYCRNVREKKAADRYRKSSGRTGTASHFFKTNR